MSFVVFMAVIVKVVVFACCETIYFHEGMQEKLLAVFDIIYKSSRFDVTLAYTFETTELLGFVHNI
jgi:hypothetical protein